MTHKQYQDTVACCRISLMEMMVVAHLTSCLHLESLGDDDRQKGYTQHRIRKANSAIGSGRQKPGSEMGFTSILALRPVKDRQCQQQEICPRKSAGESCILQRTVWHKVSEPDGLQLRTTGEWNQADEMEVAGNDSRKVLTAG